jgi:hypothetical protein
LEQELPLGVRDITHVRLPCRAHPANLYLDNHISQSHALAEKQLDSHNLTATIHQALDQKLTEKMTALVGTK